METKDIYKTLTNKAQSLIVDAQCVINAMKEIAVISDCKNFAEEPEDENGQNGYDLYKAHTDLDAVYVHLQKIAAIFCKPEEQPF